MRISDVTLECALETIARPGLSARITIPMRQACAPRSSNRISMLSINLDDNPTHCDTRLRCDVCACINERKLNDKIGLFLTGSQDLPFS